MSDDTTIVEAQNVVTRMLISELETRWNQYERAKHEIRQCYRNRDSLDKANDGPEHYDQEMNEIDQWEEYHRAEVPVRNLSAIDALNRVKQLPIEVLKILPSKEQRDLRRMLESIETRLCREGELQEMQEQLRDLEQEKSDDRER